MGTSISIYVSIILLLYKNNSFSSSSSSSSSSTGCKFEALQCKQESQSLNFIESEYQNQHVCYDKLDNIIDEVKKIKQLNLIINDELTEQNNILDNVTINFENRNIDMKKTTERVEKTIIEF